MSQGVESSSSLPAVRSRDGCPEGTRGRRRLEHSGPGAGFPGLQRAESLAKPIRVHHGPDADRRFLRRKWSRELDYRLIKELWAFTGNRIAVRFAYEWHDASGNWFRSYGNENWEFENDGLMAVRHACINDLPIREDERKFHWPLGRRPDDHPGLSDLGL